MKIDPDDLERRERYQLMISSIVPRPIAWVTTVDLEGVVNAAPFSFFNGISSTPPLLSVCVGNRRDGTAKDTLVNARETGEFVVNVVPADLARTMVATAAEFEPGESEVEELDIPTDPSDVVSPPRIRGVPVSLECEVDRTIPFGTTTMIVGRVLLFHIRDEVYEDGRAAFSRMRPIGRLGGFSYLDPVDGELEIRPDGK
jgi:flavin reductase (DIM6/NTAB) family NADH-FMN oxidoreductase RutF